LVYLGVILAIGAVLHVALRVFGTGLPWVPWYRPVILSCAAGLYGACSTASALDSLSRLKLG
jgi:hypothetical protein